ncbi:MAG: leucyl/phenylalanyl-tRNA--protein transferase [Burkholderiales bacterium]
MLPWLEHDDPFPAVESTTSTGLLAAGADLSVPRLIAAYQNGIFPWFSEGQPILWWSPDPRMVLFPAEVHISRSLAKTLRSGGFVVTADTAFREVIQHCGAARKAQAGTWITPSMCEAYCALHATGFAHSVETWRNGELVGGLYGVALGRAFFGESMFSRESNASKVAFATLVHQLREWHFGIIDCQMSTPHLASLGAREIPRGEFTRTLSELVHYPPSPVPWRLMPPR